MKLTAQRQTIFVHNMRRVLREGTLMEEYEELFFDGRDFIKAILEEHNLKSVYIDSIYMWEHAKIQALMTVLSIMERDWDLSRSNVGNESNESDVL